MIIVDASFLVMMLADDDSAGRQARNRARGADLAAPHLIDLGGISTDGPDDPAYITDMAQMFKQDNFAFESYFDSNDDGIAPLGSAIPDATAAYSQAFK